MAFKRRIWVAERFAWCLLLIVVVAALLGLLATGPLSGATAAEPDGLVRLHYQRFERYRAASSLDLEVAPGAASDDVVRIAIGQDYADAIEIGGILPQPQDMLASDDEIILSFRLADPGRGVRVHLSIKPHAVGIVSGTVGLTGREPIRFRQFVYP